MFECIVIMSCYTYPRKNFSSTKKPPFASNTTLNPLRELQKGILPRILCDAKCSTCIKLMLHDYAMVLPDVQQNLVQTIHAISTMSSSSFEGSACFNKLVMRAYFLGGYSTYYLNPLHFSNIYIYIHKKFGNIAALVLFPGSLYCK